MPFVNVPNAGSAGVIKDLSQHELPIQAWTDCQNIRFLDGYAYQFYGHGEVYNSPAYTPQHVLPCNVSGNRYWVYACAGKVFAVTNTGGVAVHTDITPGTIRTGVANQWTSTLLSGVPVLNAGDGTNPFYWNLNTSTVCADLPNWPTNNTCKVMRSYKNYLVALNVTRPPFAVTISSITYSGTTATVTTASAHNLATGYSITVSGATPTTYNGTYTITVTGTTTFTYTMSATPTGNASPVGSYVVNTTVNYPYMVKWSHPADPGTLPSTWDPTDSTKDAGETDIADGQDPIVDGLQLRDSFMIYKESSIWRMDFTGGQYIFRFTKVLGTSGAMNRNCIVEADGFHVVLTGSDVIVHDGVSAQSVLDKQTRRYLFQNIDTSGSSLCFVFKNPFFNEVFVCYPSIGATYCDTAMVWNYKDKTVSFRQIPNLNHANFGPVDNSLAGNWSQDSAPWGSDLSSWNGPDYVPSTARVIMASADTKLYMLDSSASFNGTIPTAYLERRGLSLGDPESVKLIRGIRPRIVGNAGDTVQIRIGYSNDPYATPSWGPTMTHTIGTTVSNDCTVAGRYIAVRFDTGSAFQWRLDSYDLDVVSGGKW